MEWHSATEFFNMGGYGLYVWGAYAMTAALLAIEPWLLRGRRARALAEVEQCAAAGRPT